MSDFIYFGHRGARGLEPENTLLSFKKALDSGLKWIELDVYSVENELIVIHDQRLERTTNGHGRVESSPLEYLRSLDAGKGEKIPFLREVLDLLDKNANINIELKGNNTAKPVSLIIEDYISRSGWDAGQFLVSSFNHYELKTFKKISPHIEIGGLTANLPFGYASFAKKLGAYSVNASLEFIDRKFVEDTHRKEMKFFVYTVNNPDDLKYVKELGVDGVFTDYPELALNG